jgi:iron-sulfur cluster assembly protein
MRTLDKTEVETTLLSLTPLAAERVRALLAERNLPDHALRVFVAGSGCSGLRYGMALEGAPAETDTSLEFDGVKVVIDPYSAQYLRGATVDYVELVTGAGFKIENPYAPASSCGCGQSAGSEGESGCGGGCC